MFRYNGAGGHMTGPGGHILHQNSEEISETLLTANGLPGKYIFKIFSTSTSHKKTTTKLQDNYSGILAFSLVQ